jgi:hypothetical protein
LKLPAGACTLSKEAQAFLAAIANHWCCRHIHWRTIAWGAAARSQS